METIDNNGFYSTSQQENAPAVTSLFIPFGDSHYVWFNAEGLSGEPFPRPPKT
jgi:hypothetical protein